MNYRYHVYQVPPGSKNRFSRYDNTEEIEGNILSVRVENYWHVYSGDIFANNPRYALHLLYEMFSADFPSDYTGSSMGTGDVILLDDGDEQCAYFVDTYDFTEVPDFLMEADTLTDLTMDICNFHIRYVGGHWDKDAIRGQLESGDTSELLDDLYEHVYMENMGRDVAAEAISLINRMDRLTGEMAE